MIALLVLFIPPLLSMLFRNKITGISFSRRKLILTYIFSAAALNWLMFMILFYLFENGGNIFAKLNIFHDFALKYFVLAVVLSLIEAVIERIIRSKFNLEEKGHEAKPRQRKKIRISSVILYGLFLVLMIVVISNKKAYHEDEIWSYGLANCQDAQVITFEDGKTYSPAVEPYAQYITVDDEYRFDYENVWENQAGDTHPPLYYALLHTICSFFPGVFSRWFAGIINIVFALLTLHILRHIISLLTQSTKLKTLLSYAFIFSSGILSAVTFMRMYIMAMFFITLLTYIIVKEAEEKKTDFRFFASLFITIVLGAMTHYYCIIYSAFICIPFLIFLLIRKKWLASIRFAVTCGLSAATSLMIFPTMYTHLFLTGRGPQTLSILSESVHEFFVRIKQFLALVNVQVFGSILLYIAAAVVLTLIIYFACGQKQRGLKTGIGERILLIFNEDPEKAKSTIIKYVLIFIPAAAYFLFVSKSALYISDRYMMPIYGIAFIGILCFVITIFSNIFSAKNIMFVSLILLSVILVNEWNTIGWPYLYRSYIPLIVETEKYSDVDCLYIYYNRYETQTSFTEVENYRSVTFLNGNDLSQLPLLDIAHENQLVVMITGNKAEILNKIKEAYPQFYSYNDLGASRYASTYYFYSI